MEDETLTRNTDTENLVRLRERMLETKKIAESKQEEANTASQNHRDAVEDFAAFAQGGEAELGNLRQLRAAREAKRQAYAHQEEKPEHCPGYPLAGAVRGYSDGPAIGTIKHDRVGY